MILKLRTSEKDGIGYQLIDCIKSIEYEFMDESKMNLGDNQYINTYPNLKNKKVTLIKLVFESGLCSELYTDDMAYILGNDGKTCDTIRS